MQRDSSPFRALLVLFLLLAAYVLLGAAPSFAAGSTPINLGPFAGDLTLPPGWVASADKALATQLLKRDGVQERAVLSFLKGENRVGFATTKEIEGAVPTAEDFVGGGPDMAKALGIAPSAIRCNIFKSSGGFDFSLCDTIAAGTGLAITGKGKPRAIIWDAMALAYERPRGGSIVS